MKPALIVFCRDKGGDVYRCVRSALAQDWPCEILLSDQYSEDNSVAEMHRAADGYQGHHEVKFLCCPIEGKKSMAMANAHFNWACAQTNADLLFPSPADDYNLPGRVRVCMDAMIVNRPAAVGVTMKFFDPRNPGLEMVSGEPKASGFVSARDVVQKFIGGSTAPAYTREFLHKVGGAGEDWTPDVYLAYLAALDRGYYVVAQPSYVHVQSYDLENTGFEGKLRQANESGDQELVFRLSELNRYQLAKLYMMTAKVAQDKYALANQADKNALIEMCLAQLWGWLEERKRLHVHGYAPGVM